MSSPSLLRTTRPKSVVPESVPTPLQDAAEAFYLDREATRSSPLTLRWYRQYIPALLEWLAERGITDPAQVTPSHVRAYLVELQDGRMAPRSVHHHASAARALFNFLTDEDLLPASPMRKVKMPHIPQDVLPAFTPEDVAAVLRACRSERDKAAVLFLLDTGCRAAEFVALTVADVDFGQGTVTIRQGKGRKGRVTFLGAKTGKALRKYLMTRPARKPTDPLWLCERGQKGMTVRGLQWVLRSLGKRAHVANCHPHTFRRTFALWSLRAGMDVFSLQKIMGHASLAVLWKYLDQSREDLQAAHREHAPVDRFL